MARSIDELRGADYIDSRDIIDRITELEGEPQDDQDREELAELREWAEAGEQAAVDWRYGAAFVRDSYFEDHARELAEDIGAIDQNAGWPAGFIDWERAAAALQMDYTSVEFSGTTYWVR